MRPAGSPAWSRAAARKRSCAWTLSTSPEWATDALDEVRREVWNTARKGGDAVLAKELKHARFALWNNPQDLTRRQHAKLARIAEVNRPLYRAYLLKEELRLVFKIKGPTGWRCWMRGFRGRAAAASPRSSHWPGRSEERRVGKECRS